MCENLIIGVLVLGGVVLGCFLTPRVNARWERKMQRRQSLESAYSEVLVSGREELLLCQSLDTATIIGDSVRIKADWKKLPGFPCSQFLVSATRCRLLERDEELRKRLKVLEDQYIRCTKAITGRALDCLRGEKKVAQKKKDLAPEHVREGLEALGEEVALRYFRK